MSVAASTTRGQQARPEARCEHCGRPVVVARMKTSGKRIQLDPTAGERGNLQLLRGGHLGPVAQFIAAERRDPKSRWFVPPAERFVSHMVTCEQNERTLSSTSAAFIGDVEGRLAEVQR